MTNIEKIMERFDEECVVVKDSQNYALVLYAEQQRHIKQFICTVIEEVVNDLVGEDLGQEIECNKSFIFGYNQRRRHIIQRAKDNWNISL